MACKHKHGRECRKGLASLHCGDRDYCPEYQLRRYPKVITPKVKVRKVKVKAWAHGPWTGEIETLVWFAGKKGKKGQYDIPVTILVDEKWLKGGKV